MLHLTVRSFHGQNKALHDIFRGYLGCPKIHSNRQQFASKTLTQELTAKLHPTPNSAHQQSTKDANRGTQGSVNVADHVTDSATALQIHQMQHAHCTTPNVYTPPDTACPLHYSKHVHVHNNTYATPVKTSLLLLSKQIPQYWHYIHPS